MIALHGIEGDHFRLAEAAVPAGEFAAFVAPTAACAREFVDLLLGLVAPRCGTVQLLGHALEELGERERLALRAQVGFSAQLDGLIGHLPLGENILLGAAYHRRADAAALDARLRVLLGWCGWPIEEARRAFRQSVATATPYERAAAAWLRAVLGEPKLLICEDIFAGLAPDRRRRLIDASVAFQAEDPGRGTIFVLVGDRFLEELQPTSVFYLSLHGDFRAESSS